MKILWVNVNFLHPTTKGGQIRTLEMLKRLHARHQVHYVAFEQPGEPEGPRRASEYSTRAYVFRHHVPEKTSLAFYGQLAAGLFSRLPVAVGRFRSQEMEEALERLMRQESFDAAVCDFLVSAAHFPKIERAVLFQHNVETMIWRRHAQHAPEPVRRAYLNLQAQRMFHFEREICLRAGHVVAVSPNDAATMRDLFGLTDVSDIPTGVDVDYFAPPPAVEPETDLVFVGSMDWMPNIDGMIWFMESILPAIRRRKPDCTVTIVGRSPTPQIRAWAERDPAVRVTGTVPDVRRYLWGAKLSIVPLRIGGGTRLKIYESMAAGVPVVSTAVGAEGLSIQSGENIVIKDHPEAFADACVDLLNDIPARVRMASIAREMVCANFSWEPVTRCFENILEQASEKARASEPKSARVQSLP